MSSSNELTLTIKGNSSQLIAALNKAGAAVDGFANKSSSSGNKSKNAFSGLSGAVSVAAGNLISAGIHKSFDMISNSVDDAIHICRCVKKGNHANVRVSKRAADVTRQRSRFGAAVDVEKW